MRTKVSIPLEEQETVINFFPVEMGKNCEVYTTVPSMMKYLEKMVAFSIASTSCFGIV